MKRPLFYVAVVLSLGIASQRVLSIPFSYAFVGACVFLILAAAYSRRLLLSHAGLYLSIFFLGALLYQNSVLLPADHISNILSPDGKRVFLKGVIIDDPVKGTTAYDTERLTFTLKMESVRDEAKWRASSGLVRAHLYTKDKDFACGDRVILEGILSKPHGLKNPGLFDYSRYLETKDIYAVLNVRKNFSVIKTASGRTDPVRAISYALRRRAGEALERNFEQPHLGFLKAILIGEREALEYALNDDFIKTGTVHILSISGQHVTIVAVMLLWVFSVLGIPRRPAYIIATFSLVFYFFLAGSSPPVARSVIMFAVFSIGCILYRESDILNALSAAAIVMLAAAPKELFDPSFQLSFLSILSIAVLAPRIDGILLRGRARPESIKGKAAYYILKSVSVSAAATVGVAPVVAHYFNIMSPVAIAANLIVIPAVFAVMALAFLFLSLSLFAGAAAGFVAPALVLADKILFAANHALAALPFSSFRAAAPSGLFLAMYYALLYILFAPRARRYGLIALLLFLAVAVWERNAAAASGGLRVSFLDVGRGDCELVEFPDGSNILIDAGPGGADGKFDAGRSVVAPYLWNRHVKRIDLLVVSHLHADHLGGVSYILDNFDVKCVMDAIGRGTEREAGLTRAYKRLIEKKRIRHLTVRAGEKIYGFKDAEIFVLNPPGAGYFKNENDNSVVLKLVYKKLAILFCGDITSAAMESLASYEDILRADMLKVPHHGGSLGDYAIVERFFEKISPRVSIVSSGPGSRENFEASGAAHVLTCLGSKIYSIIRDGAIIAISDGRWAKVEEKTNFFIFYLDN